MDTNLEPQLSTITATPMSGTVGAKVIGKGVGIGTGTGTELDLTAPLSKAVCDEIWSAFLHYGMLWFPNQSLSPVQQAAFAENFGGLDEYPFVTPLPEHDKVVPIIKEPETKMNFGGGWHTDTSYLPEPPSVTMLQAVEIPDRGGDTLFADMTRAFESLSSGMQEMLSGLTGIYSAEMVHGAGGAYSKKAGADHPMDYGDSKGVANRAVEHPIIRTHPETGRKAIYAGLGHCSHIKNMTKEESRLILEWIYKHATRAEFVTRLTWQAGSLAMWDNRCLFHYAMNDYPGKRRQMHRIILKGDKPH